ncbi:phosphotransferase [Bacillus sp. EB01]|uniref:phosphotransferase n=1 Tax=Bacillus sp. EB01 TaxID=1347086 RepID=UPI0005C546B0|nr:phosphotransferase [Bacillus sp. EB01]
MEKIDEIIDLLITNGLLLNDDLELKEIKKGTTSGVLYTLLIRKIPAYVIKVDSPKIIKPTQDFLLAYQDVTLLPDVLYTDEKQEFIVYSYISGETHFNRGQKLEWMTIFIRELFNKYKSAVSDISWGRVNGIQRNTWVDFNQASLGFAQENIADLLPSEDHKRIERLVTKLNSYHLQEKKYYLHGDTGVHNFVFKDNQLKGVIDPSPLIGPKIYDFTYAFCSSPDSLDLHTLFSLFSSWNSDASFTKERLLDEVLFQLYTRIGVCIKVHPHDLSGYMEAWKQWRGYLPALSN